MKISIVTISYNQAQFIERTILSIIEQNYSFLEYIIVDAGSNDGSQDIIQKYSNEISTILFEPDKGPAEGLNKGFKLATGDIIGWVNSDDILLPGALKEVNLKFKDNNMNILLGRGFKIDIDDKIIGEIIPDKFSAKKYAYGMATFSQPSCFISRKCFYEVKGFNLENRTCWDGELLFQIAQKKFTFGYTTKYLSGFRIYNESITGSATNQDEYTSDRKNILASFLKGKSPKFILLYQFIYLIINSVENPKKIINRFKRLIG